MQLATAIMRLFEVPELVAHLARHFLDHKSISCLMRTSRHLYALWTPALFYNVFAGYSPKKQNILASKESIEALARNVHHVRHLELRLLDMVYYVNCVFAYQDQDQSSTLPLTDTVVTMEGEQEEGREEAQEKKAQEQEAQKQDVARVSRPRWLAPPDPRICVVFPVPPMTLLTRLDLDVSYFRFPGDCPYLLPSCRDPRATLTQTCWLLNFNPLLTDLRLRNLLIKDQRDIRLLSRSISGLKRLQNVQFEFIRWEYSSAIPNLLLAMFLCCAPSLRTLCYEVTEHNYYWCDYVTEEYNEREPGELHSWESYGDEEDEGENEDKELRMLAFRRQQEPMIYLTSLRVWGKGQDELSEDGLRGMLALCPNLTDIVIPAFYSIENPQQLAQDVAHRFCPKLKTLEKSQYAGDIASWELIFRILEALPEQQVQKFHCVEQLFMIPGLNRGDIESIFRRQSRTLRELTLEGCRNFDSKAIQMILVECVTLEQLEVRFRVGPQLIHQHQEQQQQQEQEWPLCFELEDAVEFPWGCTRIRVLTLTIAIPDQPLHHLAKGVAPFYDRPSPTILTEEEEVQFRSLETFYRQLGALTELERLDLKTIYYDPTGSRPVSGLVWRNSFPGMLSLRDEETGRPGYLHHLGGLNKLKALFGSVSVMTEETKVTIGMEEVKWMDSHWPALEKAYFFTNKDEKLFTEPFQWLVKQRAGGDKPLQLATTY